MRRFFFRRLLQSILLIFIIIFINFIILRITPGDPISIAKAQGDRFNSSQAHPDQAGVQKQLKIYTDPLPIAFFNWTLNALTLDFGTSLQTKLPVTPNVVRAAINSFWLLVGGLLLGMLGIPLGIYASLHRGKVVDSFLQFITLLFTALPGWFLALLITFAYIQLVYVPTYLKTGEDLSFPQWFSFLPTFFIAVIFLSRFFIYSRSQTLEVLQEDYVRTARAKGLPNRIVLLRHIFRNSLSPLISILGGLIPFIFSAQILIESSARGGGLGGLFIRSAASRDYTTLMAIFTVLAVACVLCSFLADMAYALSDPRVSHNSNSTL